MHTPPNPEACHTCRHLMREPASAAAKQMAEASFYNCKLLPAESFHAPAARCTFTPSRHARQA